MVCALNTEMIFPNIYDEPNDFKNAIRSEMASPRREKLSRWISRVIYSFLNKKGVNDVKGRASNYAKFF